MRPTAGYHRHAGALDRVTAASAARSRARRQRCRTVFNTSSDRTYADLISGSGAAFKPVPVPRPSPSIRTTPSDAPSNGTLELETGRARCPPWPAVACSTTARSGSTTARAPRVPLSGSGHLESRSGTLVVLSDLAHTESPRSRRARCRLAMAAGLARHADCQRRGTGLQQRCHPLAETFPAAGRCASRAVILTLTGTIPTAPPSARDADHPRWQFRHAGGDLASAGLLALNAVLEFKCCRAISAHRATPTGAGASPPAHHPSGTTVDAGTPHRQRRHQRDGPAPSPRTARWPSTARMTSPTAARSSAADRSNRQVPGC